MSPGRCPSAVALLALATLILSVPGEARERKRRGEEEKDLKPRLRLVSDQSVGFAPVTAVLTGQLTGVDPGDANFCHAAVTWIRIDPGLAEAEGIRVRESPACLHPKDEIAVPTSFTKSYTLYRPGSYLFRLIVEGKDGARIVSPYVKVEVLRVQ